MMSILGQYIRWKAFISSVNLELELFCVPLCCLMTYHIISSVLGDKSTFVSHSKVDYSTADVAVKKVTPSTSRRHPNHCVWRFALGVAYSRWAAVLP